MRYIIISLLLLSACRAPQGELLDSPLVPRVQVLLGSTRTEIPRLVLGDEPTLPGGAYARCYQDYILVMGDGQKRLDFVIAHELVHWYIDDSPYAGLPHFIEEGLADWVSCRMMGLMEARIHEAANIGELNIDPRHLELGVREAR